MAAFERPRIAVRLISVVFSLNLGRTAVVVTPFVFGSCRSRLIVLGVWGQPKAIASDGPQSWVDRMQKHQPTPAIGSRIRLSALGMERCSKLKSPTGMIVGTNRICTSFRILIDGRSCLSHCMRAILSWTTNSSPAAPQSKASSVGEPCATAVV
jgi:hypothetical protein